MKRRDTGRSCGRCWRNLTWPRWCGMCPRRGAFWDRFAACSGSNCPGGDRWRRQQIAWFWLRSWLSDGRGWRGPARRSIWGGLHCREECWPPLGGRDLGNLGKGLGKRYGVFVPACLLLGLDQRILGLGGRISPASDAASGSGLSRRQAAARNDPTLIRVGHQIRQLPHRHRLLPHHHPPQEIRQIVHRDMKRRHEQQ